MILIDIAISIVIQDKIKNITKIKNKVIPISIIIIILCMGGNLYCAELDKKEKSSNTNSELYVTEEQVKAIILAVKDEIYAYGYEKYYIDYTYDKINIYINPKIEEGLIFMIYKLFPHGEVYRAGFIRKDGVAVLYGNPEIGFLPAHGLATNTLYFPDEDVVKMKTIWKKYKFSIKQSPSPEEIYQAKKRQYIRYYKEIYDYKVMRKLLKKKIGDSLLYYVIK